MIEGKKEQILREQEERNEREIQEMVRDVRQNYELRIGFPEETPDQPCPVACQEEIQTRTEVLRFRQNRNAREEALKGWGNIDELVSHLIKFISAITPIVLALIKLKH